MKNNIYLSLLSSVCLSSSLLFIGAHVQASENIHIESSKQTIQQVLNRLFTKAKNGTITQQDADEFVNGLKNVAEQEVNPHNRFWIANSYTRYKDKKDKNLSAHLTAGTIGIEYLFLENRLTTGITFNISDTHTKTTQNGRTEDAIGNPLIAPIKSNIIRKSQGISPYLLWKINPTFYVGGLIGFDRGHSSARLLSTTDPFAGRTAKPKDKDWYYALSMEMSHPLNQKTVLSGNIGLRDVHGKQKAYMQIADFPQNLFPDDPAILNSVPVRKFHTITIPLSATLSYLALDWLRPKVRIGGEYDIHNRLTKATFPALPLFNSPSFTDPLNKRKKMGTQYGLGVDLFENLPISASLQYLHSDRGRKVKADIWGGQIIIKF
ncbi:MAG: autotransporter outer membrane beta-barrel domain-containing protein [Alphaproteobacteria bacterium]|nr:autotransporter outer membrane beta-barrel domain-containing protein [Alphaproteobacteria bacterium]